MNDIDRNVSIEQKHKPILLGEVFSPKKIIFQFHNKIEQTICHQYPEYLMSNLYNYG